MLPTFLVIAALMVLYWFPVRRWFGRWGTTDEDLTRVMLGDRVSEAASRSTEGGADRQYSSEPPGGMRSLVHGLTV